jgi:hypothetical protein
MTGYIIVDADPSVYRAAFAAQGTTYEIIYTFLTDEVRVDRVEGDSRARQKELVAMGAEILDVSALHWKKDFSIAKYALDAQLKGIFRHCSEHEPLRGQHVEMQLILSGMGNFRNDIATVLPYKGNRASKPAPLWKSEVLKYLKSNWKADVVDGIEADDEVGIRMTSFARAGVDTILATIDKDLDQIPGWHYDYKNHVFYHVSDDEAMCKFYAQAMSGDMTDYVRGARGVGPETARKMVDAIYEDHGLDHERLWNAVVVCYAEYGVEGYEGNKTPYELALEMAQLVWLQKEPFQTWTPALLARS